MDLKEFMDTTFGIMDTIYGGLRVIGIAGVIYVVTKDGLKAISKKG